MKSFLIHLNICRKWLLSFFETGSFSLTLFHKRYYNIGQQTTFNTYWAGVRTYKCPLDMWIYQEILWEKKPDIIIECGTKYGGSALYLAHICDVIGKGRIVSIDIEDISGRPVHNRIAYTKGSSTDPDIVAKVASMIKRNESVMVILDSNHRRDHVFAELQNYAPLVTNGQYIIVEDTNINGHPARPSFGPGPMEAVLLYMKERNDFILDRAREKFMLTYNPRGYWIKK